MRLHPEKFCGIVIREKLTRNGFFGQINGFRHAGNKGKDRRKTARPGGSAGKGKGHRMNKISIIGAGSVGSTIANDLVAMNIATEILLIDINEQKAFGEAMDIYQGTGFTSPAVVRPGRYEDAVGSSIVIITSGVARKPGQTRLELAQTNVNILKQITPNIVKYAPEAIYIMVSNPVDVMTYVFHKISGIPAERIIGSGTVLDTARLQTELAGSSTSAPRTSMPMFTVSTGIPPSCPGLWQPFPTTM